MLFIGLIVGIISLLFGAAQFFSSRSHSIPASASSANVAQASSASSSSQDQGAPAAAIPEIQAELNQLSAQMVAELRSEERLNLNMVAQLRAYREMLKQIDGYARKIERDIDVIEEISKDEFQEDVRLQASLFAGKKPNLVARHLEEFRASRVGAILSKMKQKEASAVLDVWAKQEDPRVSAFYREVMAAYLNNKRRDAHPELFDKLRNGPNGSNSAS